ncbi:MAG: glycoside hydrolase family 31 protein [Anaerolineae bacterium]|nr:glycoside hydrolase family 31 protein [Anaerolineae bacterium]
MVMSLATGGVLRVDVLAPHTFRVRLCAAGTFEESSLVRYGVVHTDFSLAEEIGVEESEDAFTIRTSEAILTLQKADGQMTLTRAGGTILTRDAVAPWSDSVRGFGAEFTLTGDEKLYGLGDVTRDHIQKRGFRAMMWVCNVQSYVPIPYVMSTRGWALFLNTTWRHFFDLGATQPDRLCFWGKQGELDYFLFVGEDFAALLDHYTDVVGKPHLLPLWGYTLTFVSNQQADAREMLDDCLNFRRENIPCDIIGLEPGWMETYYDYTIEKKWHPERFYIPYWAPIGPQTFLGAAQRLGFKTSLWLCCDYDLSFEAERRVGTAGYQPPEEKTQHADDFELDYHQHTPVMMDTLTKPTESWFEHLKPFMDQGVSAFKLDGARQVNEHPDRKWGNGMDDEEMHNLYPTLLNQQMHVGFKEHTGRRPMLYSSGGYVGIQQFSATWAGDTGGGPKPLVSMLNHGFSGHSNVSCDMDVFTPAGIHFGFLQTWSQVCSWAYWRHPWLLGETLSPIFKFYARLRYRLLPYIYTMAHIAARTGFPVMRAMSLVYPDDARSDTLIHQYMLGDAFLVTAFTNEVHLPAGMWIDYWTGEWYEGPQDMAVEVPPDRGGPLFIKAGSIVPMWPDMDYVGQKPVEMLELHVYPPLQGTCDFTLYEDDGESFAYLEGALAETSMTCTSTQNECMLTIYPRTGCYECMPSQRAYHVVLHHQHKPVYVWLNEHIIAQEGWVYDVMTQSIELKVAEDEMPAVIRMCWE